MTTFNDFTNLIFLYQERDFSYNCLQCIAKLLLISFWGNLGMRDDMPKTRYLNSYQEVVD